MALVKLLSAGGYVEAQLVKGLLETEGIKSVIQGESRNTDMGTEAGFGEIAILVDEADLEEAKVVVEAKAVADAAEKSGALAEGAVCPVHEEKAVAICSRCGNHLCASCQPFGDPPLCDDCDQRLAAQAPKKRTTTRLVAMFMLALFFGLPTAIVLIYRLFAGHR